MIRKQVELRGVKIGAPTEIRIFPSKSSTEIKNLPLHKLSVKLKMSKFVLALFPEELLLNGIAFFGSINFFGYKILIVFYR